jgi:hypothetical protein
MDAQQLARLAAQGGGDACACRVRAYRAWSSINDSQWPASMEKVATLRDATIDELTYEELHLGTRYDSPDAPVAPAYFPYNRCDLYRCRDCGTHALRYTEFGDYYVDHRVRCLQGLTVLDLPAVPAEAGF